MPVGPGICSGGIQGNCGFCYDNWVKGLAFLKPRPGSFRSDFKLLKCLLGPLLPSLCKEDP